MNDVELFAQTLATTDKDLQRMIGKKVKFTKSEALKRGLIGQNCIYTVLYCQKLYDGSTGLRLLVCGFLPNTPDAIKKELQRYINSDTAPAKREHIVPVMEIVK